MLMSKHSFLVAIVALGLFRVVLSGELRVCDPKRYEGLGLEMSQFAFCNASLPYDMRASDLVSRMTLEEKARQLGDYAFGVNRLGLPEYKWWNEALHGISNVGRYKANSVLFDQVVPGATSFPTVILTTASFNESLWKRIGQVISNEARAMHNLGRAGLTFWSPVINVARDPRWGRIQETPGEDPFVVGVYAINFVRGLQDVRGTENFEDPNSRPLKVSACCKHYTAYDVDNWHGIQRYSFDAKVTEQDMAETFNPPFEMCVKEGDVSSVMCSYNRINGIPSCADPELLNNTIRGDWDLHGYIVADCDSVQVMVDNHKFLNDTPEDAVSRTFNAGLDLDCGDYYTKYIPTAAKQKKIDEGEVDKSLRYLYVVLMRLGFFDGSPEFKNLGRKDVCSAQNIELATDAARQGIVLMKNDGALPLSSGSIKSIAVVGPHANATKVMIGNYAGVPCRYTTPVDGFSVYSKVQYAAGCIDVACKNESSIPSAVDAAKNADATVVIVGLDLGVEAESLDRDNLLLPGYQTQLVNQVADAARGPVILVIFSAGGVDITFAKNNPKIKAILWVGYPGEEGGHAIADVVFGAYNPGGKLPITWYQADYVNKLPMTSMQLRPDPANGYPGRTYKFFDGPVVYPFGYGLSYTQFNYTAVTSPSIKQSISIPLDNIQHCRDLQYTNGSPKPPCPAVLINDLSCDVQFQFEVDVKVQNTGKRDGSEVVIIYSKPPAGVAGTHMKQVIGFRRVFLGAGQGQDVKFQFNACKSLGIVDGQANKLLPSGQHTIVVGDNLASLSLQVDFGGAKLTKKN